MKLQRLFEDISPQTQKAIDLVNQNKAVPMFAAVGDVAGRYIQINILSDIPNSITKDQLYKLLTLSDVTKDECIGWCDYFFDKINTNRHIKSVIIQKLSDHTANADVSVSLFTWKQFMYLHKDDYGNDFDD